ncbi:LacI family DNA-binding transcriptional regulator [Niabella aurantiaca]|uniref:LacI family DNA-binding transcriptional regulator n=1 Tax=Niabella aurantiaca TaxID=379900 RepID=UPI0003618F8E|nr:LacI family DNA-binding transcriptional regulator [Niabella aurantiaca]
MKNVTIKTISEVTGRSLTTVSRVLNGSAKKYRIKEETQKLVLDAAHKLNYAPNQAAVSLRLNRSLSIGLVIPTLSNPYFADVASLVSHSLRTKGYSVLLMDCDEKEAAEIEAVRLLAAQNVGGVIIIPSGSQSAHIEVLLKRGIPVVCIDRYHENIPVSYVATNHYEGAYAMTQYLISCGHKRIACLQGSHAVISNNLRVKGYRDAMGAGNLPVYSVAGNSFTRESGYIETKLLLQKKEKPTAVFALSDTILLGALKAIKEENIKVPADISVVTFDNSSYLDFLACPVTSIEQPVGDIANMSIKLLQDRIKSHNREAAEQQMKVLINPRIVFRQSVKMHK